MEKWAYAGSATATFINRNSYATFLSLGLVSATALTRAEVQRAQDAGLNLGRALLAGLPAAVCWLVILSALVATNSRMGLFAGGCGAAVVAALAVARGGWMRALAIVVLVLVAGALGLWLYGQGLIERLASAERDFDVRASLYGEVAGLIAQRPLLGFGGGSFEYAFPLVHALPVSLDLVWDRAHSTYLALWSEFGVIAGSLPLVTLAALLLRLTVRYFGAATVAPHALAAIGAIVVAAIHSLTDFSLEIPAGAYLFAATVGLGMSALAGRSRRRHA
jgi:O-antigen ligase